eukprot:scaffold14974_cov195-Amphora_coffeaeformis.AAC.45
MCYTQQQQHNNPGSSSSSFSSSNSHKMSLSDVLLRELFPAPHNIHNSRTKLHVQPRWVGNLTPNDWQVLLQALDGKEVQEIRLLDHHHHHDDDDDDEYYYDDEEEDEQDTPPTWRPTRTKKNRHHHHGADATMQQRVRTLLEQCPNVTRLCLPCVQVPMVIDMIRRQQERTLRDLEIHGIPLPLEPPTQQQQQPHEEGEGEEYSTNAMVRKTTAPSRSPTDVLISYLFPSTVATEDGQVVVNDDDEQRQQQQQQQNHQLERLALHGMEDGDSYATLSAETLLQCLLSPSLKKLELNAMEILPSPAVPPRRLGRALRHNQSLELLRTRCGRVPSDILLEIGRALWDDNRTLYYVDIGSLEGVTDAVAQTFTTVMACNAVFRSFECNLNSISNFNFLSLQNMFCMDISDNLLGDEGALLIANCLPGASIERLNFADNGITRVGASAIAWGMGQCKYLNICNICDNPVTQESDMDTIRSPLARAVLAKVRASPAYSHGFLGMLCAALKDHQSMEHLNLASTGLTDKDGALLALLLRVSCVRQLFVGRNNLADETCGHLYSVLGDDQCELTSLSLQLNSFTALGFYTLWQGILRTNSKLQNVQIGLRTYSIYGQPRGQRDIDIALRLNQAGRIRLLRDRSATIQEWLECLFAVADDVDCSFALLRENPSLCTAAGVAK